MNNGSWVGPSYTGRHSLTPDRLWFQRAGVRTPRRGGRAARLSGYTMWLGEPYGVRHDYDYDYEYDDEYEHEHGYDYDYDGRERYRGMA
jgi:hypothetical protein